MRKRVQTLFIKTTSNTSPRNDNNTLLRGWGACCECRLERTDASHLCSLDDAKHAGDTEHTDDVDTHTSIDKQPDDGYHGDYTVKLVPVIKQVPDH